MLRPGNPTSCDADMARKTGRGNKKRSLENQDDKVMIIASDLDIMPLR